MHTLHLSYQCSKKQNDSYEAQHETTNSTTNTVTKEQHTGGHLVSTWRCRHLPLITALKLFISLHGGMARSLENSWRTSRCGRLFCLVL